MDINKEEKIQIIHKEIDLLQNCINRMARNSFLIKGWLISLISVLIGLKPESINIKCLLSVLVLVTLVFWYLDAFFLNIENNYRIKYEYIIKERLKENFSDLYDLNPNNIPEKCKDKVKSVFQEMTSITLRRFYLTILIGIIIIFVVSLY